MKLAVVFEIPDDQADAYADTAARMIERHKFAEQELIAHWSFDRAMRPVAAIMFDSDVAEGAAKAFPYVEGPQPWIPGLVFRYHQGFKTALLHILAALRA